MKRLSNWAFIVLFLMTSFLSFLYVAGFLKEDGNIVLLLDKGLASYEQDSICLDRVKQGIKYDNDSAKKAFELAYSFVPSDIYVKYCLGAYYYLNHDYESVLGLLGTKWYSVEISYLQIQSALALKDTIQIKNAVKNLAVNKPDILESLFFEDIIQLYPLLLESSLSEARKELFYKSKCNDIMAIARLAKLELSAGDIHSADSLLSIVTARMPNLSRPWSYRACVDILRSETSKYRLYLKRAKMFSYNDNIPIEIENYLNGDSKSSFLFAPVSGVQSLEQAYDTRFKSKTYIIKDLQEYLRPNILKLLNYDTDK